MSVPTIGSKFGDAPVAPAVPQTAPARDAVPASTLSTQAPTQQSPRPSLDDVMKAIQAIKEKIEPVASNNLQFSVDQDSGDTVVRITDSQTGDLVRQIPSEETLAIARDLNRIKGLLLQQKA